MYYFLKTDFEALNAEIDKLCDKIKAIGQDMGQSCQQGAETFHDNFAFEDGERQQYMWSGQLRDLIRIRNNARITVPEASNERVSIGKTIAVEIEETEESKTLTIGSYRVFEQNGDVISYNAPLARLLLGAKVGDTREGVIAGKKRTLTIVEIK